MDSRIHNLARFAVAAILGATLYALGMSELSAFLFAAVLLFLAD